MRTLSNEIIGFINMFEKVTHAEVKDCFLDENVIVFVVQPGMVGKAVGKEGSNIRKVSAMFKKQVRILAFDPDPVRFVANLLYPVKPEEIRQEDNLIVIKASNAMEKGKIYGREKTNFKKLQEILSKYFPFELKLE